VRKTLRKGMHEYQIVRGHGAGSQDNFMEFYGRSSARSFLQGLMGDHSNMMTMRQILRESALQQNLSRLNDQEIIGQLAVQVATGQVRIVEEHYDAPSWTYEPFVEAAPGPGPTSASRAKPAEPVQPVEKKVDPALVAQAATMKEAAQSGAPFCEQ
jgi:hypothetical protein